MGGRQGSRGQRRQHGQPLRGGGGRLVGQGVPQQKGKDPPSAFHKAGHAYRHFGEQREGSPVICSLRGETFLPVPVPSDAFPWPERPLLDLKETTVPRSPSCHPQPCTSGRHVAASVPHQCPRDQVGPGCEGARLSPPGLMSRGLLGPRPSLRDLPAPSLREENFPHRVGQVLVASSGYRGCPLGLDF